MDLPGLFLTDVTAYPEGYEAVNTSRQGQTRYRVSTTKVRIGSTEFEVTYREP